MLLIIIIICGLEKHKGILWKRAIQRTLEGTERKKEKKEIEEKGKEFLSLSSSSST